MVPLIGHTLGHAGVAVLRGDKWLFSTGDAYFWHSEMDPRRPRCTPGLRLYQWMMQKDGKARLWNQERLRQLKRENGGDLELFCGHDPLEFQRLAGRPLDQPVGRAALGHRLHRPVTSGQSWRPAPMA